MVEGRDIAVVDPTTFGVVSTIEPIDFDPPLGVQINALALGPDALWVVNDESGILQRSTSVGSAVLQAFRTDADRVMADTTYRHDRGVDEVRVGAAALRVGPAQGASSCRLQASGV